MDPNAGGSGNLHIPVWGFVSALVGALGALVVAFVNFLFRSVRRDLDKLRDEAVAELSKRSSNHEVRLVLLERTLEERLRPMSEKIDHIDAWVTREKGEA